MLEVCWVLLVQHQRRGFGTVKRSVACYRFDDSTTGIQPAMPEHLPVQIPHHGRFGFAPLPARRGVARSHIRTSGELPRVGGRGQLSDGPSLQPLQQHLQRFVTSQEVQTVESEGFGGRPATTVKSSTGHSGAPGLSRVLSPRTGQAPGRSSSRTPGRLWNVTVNVGHSSSASSRSSSASSCPRTFTSQEVQTVQYRSSFGLEALLTR